MQDLDALFQLLAMLVTEPRTAVLFVLLVIASISDYRTYKIPNWLTAGGIVFALIYNTEFPFIGTMVSSGPWAALASGL